MMENSDLFNAEALGEIHTLKDSFDVVEPIEDKPIPEIIDNPEMFRMAIGQVQLQAENGDMPYLTVSPRLMKYLARSEKIRSLTYGSPGVRVYIQGAKEELDRVESMSTDAFHQDAIKNLHDEAIRNKK